MASTPTPAGRLQKPPPDPRLARRPASAQYASSPTVAHDCPESRNPLPIATTNDAPTMSPAIAADHGILMPPQPHAGPQSFSRSSSYDWTSRPTTPTGNSSPRITPANNLTATPTTPALAVTSAGSASPNMLTPPSIDRSKRRSWFGRSKDKGQTEKGPAAWIIGHEGVLPYDISGLVAGQPVRNTVGSEGSHSLTLCTVTRCLGCHWRLPDIPVPRLRRTWSNNACRLFGLLIFSASDEEGL